MYVHIYLVIYISRNDEIRVVDLQMVRRARPTIDLAYFFASSLSPEFRENHLQELLKYYHLSLTKCLVNLGYDEDLYTFDSFKGNFEECYIYGVGYGTIHAQVWNVTAIHAFRVGGMVRGRRIGAYPHVVI